jgi:hypothetical protein
MISIHINNTDNDYITFSSIEEIPKEYYKDIVYLNCYNSNIYNIDFIKEMPNLIKLIASNNFIKELPQHDKLEYIDINTNQINIVPYFPNIKQLHIHFNNINKFPYLSTLEILDISNNFLIELQVPYNIIKLYCNDNNITKLSFNKLSFKHIIEDRLTELNISYNKITNINFIFNFKNIQSFLYNNNIIDFIPPYIERYIMIKLYSYQYNYYNNSHHISTDIIKRILDVMNINSTNDIHINNINNIINKLNPNAKKLVELYYNYDYVHKKMLITFKEFFITICYLYYNDQLIEKLNKLYENIPLCKCTSCLILDIISIL